MARRCPQRIFDLFATDEAGASLARAQAIEWLRSQPAKPGDAFIIPHPETGEEMIVDYTPEKREDN